MATRSPVKLEITTDPVGGGWQAELLIDDVPVRSFPGRSEFEAYDAAIAHVRAVFKQESPR